MRNKYQISAMYVTYDELNEHSFIYKLKLEN